MPGAGQGPGQAQDKRTSNALPLSEHFANYLSRMLITWISDLAQVLMNGSGLSSRVFYCPHGLSHQEEIQPAPRSRGQ